MSVSVLDPETDIMDQFLDPETDIMGERTFMKLMLNIGLWFKNFCKDTVKDVFITKVRGP